ncbi:MAG: hypothetical protein WBQ25_07880 [Nitrososphaeraceae archaeon]
MTSQHRWVCTICGDGFTRRSTASRHSRNLHAGNSMIVRPFEYIVGRQDGRFPEPIDPLLFRKNNNKKTENYNNNATYPVYSHETYNNSSKSYQNYNNFNIYRMQTSYPQLDHSSPVVPQQSFHKLPHDDKQSSYSPKPLEMMSKLEKHQELERLVIRYYTPYDAQRILKVIHAQVFNLGDESFLDGHLKLLLDIERTKSR